ncbi:hypothetical protein HPP92_025201 [Vanilla planifolia]|uniref:Uncharacterized protein n=1 Tax=Vanilla planifolia TaxID=51239 RepID=A0A835PPL0_VANPL|nr:hypothetical protein HPP92_025201 [Vanilla planifolia]
MSPQESVATTGPQDPRCRGVPDATGTDGTSSFRDGSRQIFSEIERLRPQDVVYAGSF